MHVHSQEPRGQSDRKNNCLNAQNQLQYFVSRTVCHKVRVLCLLNVSLVGLILSRDSQKKEMCIEEVVGGGVTKTSHKHPAFLSLVPFLTVNHLS